MTLRNTNLLVENLYYLLWLKDSGLKDASFAVKIPDTIIVQQGKILNWFFSSRSGEGVMMKKEANLNGPKIFESFTKKESKSGIVACFIENIRHYNQVEQNGQKQSNLFDLPEDEGDIVVRYLTKDKLKSLLFEDQIGEKSGILQAFVHPYGQNESLIQAVWSPQLCIFSKRVNYRHLYDKRYDPYERATTFDGAEMYSRTVPLRGKLISQEMRRFCENIVDRISNVTFQKTQIQRMVVYFKADTNNTINFLYCSCLRLQGERIDPKLLSKLHHKVQNTPSSLELNFQKPPEIKLNYTTNTMRPVSLENDIQCFHCQEKIQMKDLVAVTYEFIINNFEENPNVAHSKVSKVAVLEAPEEQDFILNKQLDHFVKDKSSEIPHLISKMYPKLTIETYRIFRLNKKFLSQKIRLCQNCYLDFSRYVKMSGAPLKGTQNFEFMKKGLAKRGSLFSREMKAIVAAKNVEMTEQKGSEFVKHQNREVFQRMLDNLLEEMARIEREQKKKPSEHLTSHLKGNGSNQDSIPEETQSQYIPSTRPESSMSGKSFDPKQKLKTIHKVIEKINNRAESANEKGYQLEFDDEDNLFQFEEDDEIYSAPRQIKFSNNMLNNAEDYQLKQNEYIIGAKKRQLNVKKLKPELLNSNSTKTLRPKTTQFPHSRQSSSHPSLINERIRPKSGFELMDGVEIQSKFNQNLFQENNYIESQQGNKSSKAKVVFFQSISQQHPYSQQNLDQNRIVVSALKKTSQKSDREYFSEIQSKTTKSANTQVWAESFQENQINDKRQIPQNKVQFSLRPYSQGGVSMLQKDQSSINLKAEQRNQVFSAIQYKSGNQNESVNETNQFKNKITIPIDYNLEEMDHDFINQKD